MTEPTEIKTAEDRGMKLRFWLATRPSPIQVKDFAHVTGLGTATLQRYFRGEVDLANIEYDEANALLKGMGISDSEARELLAIPEAVWGRFRSERKPPMGSGPLDAAPSTIELTEPLHGHDAQRAGVRIVLEPENLTDGTQVVRLADGRLISVPADMAGEVSGKRLGRLAAVYF